jgi:D-isomer specific 2-hydroxyacid dehydrogenase, NAD binding domain
MSKTESTPLAVTRAVLNCASTARFSFGEETALVAVQHMLLQTVDLFKTIGAMGLKLQNVFALGKVYSNSDLVIETLKEMGVTIVQSTVPAPGEFHPNFDRDVRRLWRVAAGALAQRQIKRILVLDDAGVCITSTPAEVLRRYTLYGVEQTSQGTFLFERKPPPFGVVSWARSAVKLEIGGPIFSQSFIDKFGTEFLHGASIAGAQVGIIGLGSIGKSVANLILRQGAEISFYDPNPVLKIPGYLDELMLQSDYVIGCSGRQPFARKWLLNHRPGINLLSASGGDQEFRAIIRDLKRKSGFRVNRATWDITSAHGPSGPIRIAYSGYPYNFVSRSLEAVPTHIVQLETGGLLAALVQARLCMGLVESGKTQNTGVQRVSPQAQCFVYQRWLSAMLAYKINISELFVYDAAMLSAAQHEQWFEQNSEPGGGGPSEVEKMMIRFLRGRLVNKASTPTGA